MKTYYLLLNDQTQGPFTIGQLRSMWASGAITLETLFCREGFDQWHRIELLLPELEPAQQANKPDAPVMFKDVDANSFLGKPGTLSRTLNIGCAALIIGIIVLVLVLMASR